MDPLKARNGGALGCPVSSPEAQGHIQSSGPWGQQCPAQPGHSASRGMLWQGSDSLCPWKTRQSHLENCWLVFSLELSSCLLLLPSSTLRCHSSLFFSLSGEMFFALPPLRVSPFTSSFDAFPPKTCAILIRSNQPLKQD